MLRTANTIVHYIIMFMFIASIVTSIVTATYIVYTKWCSGDGKTSTMCPTEEVPAIVAEQGVTIQW